MYSNINTSVSLYNSDSSGSSGSLPSDIYEINSDNYKTKLENIHSKLKIKYGTFNEELDEQKWLFDI